MSRVPWRAKRAEMTDQALGSGKEAEILVLLRELLVQVELRADAIG